MKKVMKRLRMLIVLAFVCAIFVPSIKADAAGITQTGAGKDNVTISWTKDSNATGYNVYIYDYNTYTYTYKKYGNTLSPSTTSINIKGLEAGNKYKVLVYSLIGNTVSSAWELDVKTVPGKITGIEQFWPEKKKRVELMWDMVASASGYEYNLYNYKNKLTKKGSTTSGYKNYVTINKLSATQFYSVRVRAYTEVNGKKIYGDWSDKKYISTQPKVKKIRVSKGKLTINFSKITGATGYDVYVSTTRGKNFKKVKSLGKKATKVTIKKFKNKKISTKRRYYVYVVAKKKAGRTTHTSDNTYFWYNLR